MISRNMLQPEKSCDNFRKIYIVHGRWIVMRSVEKAMSVLKFSPIESLSVKFTIQEMAEH